MIPHHPDATTNIIGVASVTMPFWLPYLQEASEIASWIIPLLALIYWSLKLIRAFRSGN